MRSRRYIIVACILWRIEHFGAVLGDVYGIRVASLDSAKMCFKLCHTGSETTLAGRLAHLSVCLKGDLGTDWSQRRRASSIAGARPTRRAILAVLTESEAECAHRAFASAARLLAPEVTRNVVSSSMFDLSRRPSDKSQHHWHSLPAVVASLACPLGFRLARHCARNKGAGPETGEKLCLRNEDVLKPPWAMSSNIQHPAQRPRSGECGT